MARLCRNNLRKISLAIIQYEVAHGTLPPAYIVDENCKPMHSWRVLILPYLDQQALYDQYDFNLPWDSPHNSRLATEMPEVFKCPLSSSTVHTSYAVVNGPGLVFDGIHTTRSDDIIKGDGAGTTLLVVECHAANIPWMEPRDVDAASWSPSSPHPGFCKTTFPPITFAHC